MPLKAILNSLISGIVSSIFALGFKFFGPILIFFSYFSPFPIFIITIYYGLFGTILSTLVSVGVIIFLTSTSVGIIFFITNIVPSIIILIDKKNTKLSYQNFISNLTLLNGIFYIAIMLRYSDRINNLIKNFNNDMQESLGKNLLIEKEILDIAHAILISIFLLMIISFCKCADPTAGSIQCYYYPCFYENNAKDLVIHNKILHDQQEQKSSETVIGATKESYVIKDLGKLFKIPSYVMKPGELIIFSGDTGLGKSAFIQYIVAKAKKDTLFLSLEMKEELTFRRFVQIVNNKTKKWVDTMYKDPNISFADKLKHIKIMSIAPRVESVKKVVAEHQPNVLVIDTTDELQVDFVKGEIEKQNIIIDHLKQIAQKNNIIIIAIHHLNKASAVNNIINVHSLKGSSNIVQKADKVLMIKGDRLEQVRTICSEKSRDEGRFEMTVSFNPNTFTFKQLKY